MANKRSIVAVVGASAAALIMATTPVWEGYRSVGYIDIAGVPTKCSGDTSNVVVGKRYSEAECRESLNSALVAHAQPVVDCLPQILDNPYILAAAVDSAYNAGPGALCRSTAANHWRAGRLREGCESLREWRVTINRGQTRVRGLVNRRNAVANLCLQGVNDGR